MDEGQAQPRRQLHGYVSNEARDGWYRFAEAQGVNVTALMEAMGVRLGQSVGSDERLPGWMVQLVREARVVAAGRSSRAR